VEGGNRAARRVECGPGGMSTPHDRGPRRGESATPLSVFGSSQNPRGLPDAAQDDRARALEHVARFSLFAGVMACATGCFDAPPEYSEPTRVPPVIIADSCTPPLTALYIPATNSTSIDFKVAFRADDAGLSLRARAVRDITIGTPSFVDEDEPPPDERAFADQEPRSVTLTWEWTPQGVGMLQGCHTVTVIIADANNILGLYGARDPLQEARMTWFVWIPGSALAPDDPKSIADCAGMSQ
jgi:hypothetical protein